MRTLAIDGLRLCGPRTAMGRYIEVLSHEWSMSDLPFDRVEIHVPAEADVTGVAQAANVRLCRPSNRRLPPALWQQVALPLAIRGCSVLYGPAYIVPVVHRGPVVVANHGIYEGIPGEFSRLARVRTVPLYRYAVHRAASVIANSDSTRADLVRFLGVDRDRVDIVLPAAAEKFFDRHNPDEVAATVEGVLGRADARFALFVGKLSPRRHVPELVAAFAAARRRLDADHQLLVVGPDTHMIDVGGLAASHGIGAAVTYLPHLQQERLAHLYAAAEVFVLPTEHEGISWTMLEAMASGAPVLTVNHSALDEGAGEAVLAVSAPSVSAIGEGLIRLFGDPNERRRLSQAGRVHARNHSWEHAAARTMAILDRHAIAADRGKS